MRSWSCKRKKMDWLWSQRVHMTKFKCQGHKNNSYCSVLNLKLKTLYQANAIEPSPKFHWLFPYVNSLCTMDFVSIRRMSWEEYQLWKADWLFLSKWSTTSTLPGDLSLNERLRFQQTIEFQMLRHCGLLKIYNHAK